MREICTLELLPQETRILFDEATRKQLFVNKDQIMKTLEIHRNTANSWIRGKHKPSILQLEKLNVDIKTIWKNIISLSLEGSTKKLLVHEQLPIDKLSWLSGILDGDGFSNDNRIGIINQDTNLIKTFIEVCSHVFSIELTEFFVSAQWHNANHNIGDLLCIDRIRTYKISDSDGSFSRRNMYLTQKLTNNNMLKMELVKKILDLSKINNFGIKGPNNKNMIYIYLSSDRETLKNYRQNVGFTSKPKLDKLNKLLS